MAQAGRTADGAAGARAAHWLYDRPIVFADPWAIELVSPALRFVLRRRWLCEPLLLRGMRAFRPIIAGSLGCARHAEEQLDAAIARGVDQYLLIGAGLDSFALRRSDLAERLRVLELDHPASQRVKRARLTRAAPLPANLEFVPIDFETQTLAAALAGSSFEPTRPAFCSWLGVTPYLTPEAVIETLRSLACLLAPGSELVLNYAVRPDLVDAEDRAGLAALGASVRRRGEPFRSSFDPDAFPREAAALGWARVAQLSMAELRERYFRGRSDGLAPGLGGRLLHLALR